MRVIRKAATAMSEKYISKYIICQKQKNSFQNTLLKEKWRSCRNTLHKHTLTNPMQTRVYCLPHKHNHRHKSKETTEWSHGNILSERSPALIFRQSRMSRVEGGEMSVGTTICGRNLYFLEGLSPPTPKSLWHYSCSCSHQEHTHCSLRLSVSAERHRREKRGASFSLSLFFRLRSRSRISFPDEIQESKNLLV